MNIHIERKTKKKECTTVSVNDSEIRFRTDFKLDAKLHRPLYYGPKKRTQWLIIQLITLNY